MKYLYKIWGVRFASAAYGFLRGMRSEYEDKMIYVQPLERSTYQRSYQKFVGVNWNVIL